MTLVTAHDRMRPMRLLAAFVRALRSDIADQRVGRGVPAEPPRQDRRAAFSLIEVNMALLVVSIGLAALLGLFPVGLRESGLASADTTEAIFATRMLNAIQANAGEIDTWSEWTGVNAFIDKIYVKAGQSDAPLAVGAETTVNDANGVEDNVIRYKLDIGSVHGNLRYAAIRVADDEHSDIDNNVVYYTEFRFGSH